jgi:regulator of cell morphogenesis and NO signaling
MKFDYRVPDFYASDPNINRFNSPPDHPGPGLNKSSRRIFHLQKDVHKNAPADLPYSVDLPSRHSLDPYQWDPGFLCDYVVRIHHDYIQKALPVLVAMGKRVTVLHGKTQVETLSILDQMETLFSDLKLHLFKEEQLIFPYIRSLVCLEKQGKTIDITRDGPLYKPLAGLEEEHGLFEAGMDAIRDLSLDFTVPVKNSPVFSSWYRALQAFREDLIQHTRLESRVLFPKAIALQRKLTA